MCEDAGPSLSKDRRRAGVFLSICVNCQSIKRGEELGYLTISLPTNGNQLKTFHEITPDIAFFFLGIMFIQGCYAHEELMGGSDYSQCLARYIRLSNFP